MKTPQRPVPDRCALTVSDAAVVLHVSRKTVYREIAAGRLRAVKVRTLTRIAPADVEAYVAARQAVEPSAPEADPTPTPPIRGMRPRHAPLPLPDGFRSSFPEFATPQEGHR